MFSAPGHVGDIGLGERGRGLVTAGAAIAIAAAAGGALYNPADLSSLFQDAGATTPVTASGQPVRLMRDLSGNGFHAVAPSDAARPVLTVAGSLAYLAVDGVDDWMQVTPTLNLGEVWWNTIGLQNDTTGRYPFSLSNAATGKSGPRSNSSTTWAWRNATDTAFTALINATTQTAPHVITIQQTSTALIAGRGNGVTRASFAPFDDSASTQGLALFTGSSGAWDFGMAGRFYGGAFAPGAASAEQIESLERYVAGLSGLTL